MADWLGLAMHISSDLRRTIRVNDLAGQESPFFQVFAAVVYCFFSKTVSAIILNSTPVYATDDLYLLVCLACCAIVLFPPAKPLRDSNAVTLATSSLYGVSKGWSMHRAVGAPGLSLCGALLLGLAVGVSGDVFVDALQMYLGYYRGRAPPAGGGRLMQPRCWQIALSSCALAALQFVPIPSVLASLVPADAAHLNDWLKSSKLTLAAIPYVVAYVSPLIGSLAASAPPSSKKSRKS